MVHGLLRPARPYRCLADGDAEPGAGEEVLRTLAYYQAIARDDFQDAEPGNKILHELRRGELAFFGEVPHSPYYGTVDATPLFLVLLHEVWRWTADEIFISAAIMLLGAEINAEVYHEVAEEGGEEKQEG